ncbi:MAG TPA: TrkH family potassium uptake protein [Paucimonas sp.]|nr:TrkH family potassium uptake protein [Paucimonas sp.]
MIESPAPLTEAVLKVEKSLLRLTPPQALILSFVALALLGAVLLKLPIATREPISWLQALFTATSAATVTGFSVLDTGTHFTLFGQAVLLVLIQCGGLGLMSFGVFIIFLMRDSLTLGHRMVLSEALNQSGQSNLRRQLRWMFGFTAGMELLGTALLAIRWVPEKGWADGIYYSFFHAVSAFNNAGFALAADSLVAHVADPLVNIVITALFISGGIGFVVIADMIGKRRFRDYSLHTKLMLVGTLVVNVAAMLLLLAIEYGNPKTLGALPDFGAKLWAAWFQGVAPRSSGFNTVDVAGLYPASAVLIMVLMFIGAGSGSTASGIKLSTFMVLVLATGAFLAARDRPVVFGRSLDWGTMLKAMAISCIAMLGVLIGIFLLVLTETGAFLDLAFEAVSAFGTVGLSRGATARLSEAGQAIVIALMLIGRVGPLTLAFLFANRHHAPIQYPAGQVNIG